MSAELTASSDSDSDANRTPRARSHSPRTPRTAVLSPVGSPVEPVLSPRVGRVVRVALARSVDGSAALATDRRYFDEFGFLLAPASVDAYLVHRAETIGVEDSKVHRFSELVNLNPEVFRDRVLNAAAPLGLPRICRRSVWLTSSGARARMVARRAHYERVCAELPTALAFAHKPTECPSPELLCGDADLEREWICSVRVITADMPRTLGPHCLEDFEHYTDRMELILQRFALHSSAEGYCQGQHFMAMLMIVHKFTDEEVFWMLDAIALHIFPRSFDTRLTGRTADYNTFCYYACKNYPRLEQTAANVHLSIKLLFCDTIFGKLFIGSMPYASVCAIWDGMFVNGAHWFFIAALKIVQHVYVELGELGAFEEPLPSAKWLMENVADSLARIVDIPMLLCTTKLPGKSKIEPGALNMRRQLERCKTLSP